MKPKLSIIIKALNEEINIERAIKSCIKETKGISCEIILADSISTDKTIKLAKKYPIKIFQLSNESDKSCGVGPQLGYQHSSGKYVYILDGDMEFEPGFLQKAIKELEKNPRLAGVAGQVREMRTINFVFQLRKKRGETKPVANKRLEMGGLYKREAIEDVKYFSNRNLHAYEEAELGLRLQANNWTVTRLNIPGIKHYGYNTDSFGVFKRRWKTKYVKGSGEYLRSSLGKSYFFKTVWQMKIYLSVIAWWAIFVASLFTIQFTPLVIQIFGGLTALFLILFIIKKRNLKEFAFSIVSWHYSSVGLVWGFFTPQKNPSEQIPSKAIKK